MNRSAAVFAGGCLVRANDTLEMDMSSANARILSYREDIMDPGDISGYAIHAVDGDIGKVDKHNMDVGRSYLLVATGRWIFGKTVMLPAGVIDRIDHEHETVYVSRSRDEIKDGPEYQDEGRDDDSYH